MAGKAKYDRELLAQVCDGVKTYQQIAEELGWKKRTVARLVREENLPRRGWGKRLTPVTGINNPAYIAGRRIDLDGYVLVTAPEEHPHCRRTRGRRLGIILEHRLVLEKQLGRYLLPEEVVDHIDGLTLHNHPDNLRLFESNKVHLQATVKGRRPRWSKAGLARMNSSHPQRKVHAQVDTYDRHRKRGDVRQLQILLAALKLGIDSPYLLGAHAHMERRQIDYGSRPSLEHALDQLVAVLEQDLDLSLPEYHQQGSLLAQQ